MATSQRLSRGFHPVLVGGVYSFVIASSEADLPAGRLF